MDELLLQFARMSKKDDARSLRDRLAKPNRPDNQLLRGKHESKSIIYTANRS